MVPVRPRRSHLVLARLSGNDTAAAVDDRGSAVGSPALLSRVHAAPFGERGVVVRRGGGVRGGGVRGGGVRGGGARGGGVRGGGVRGGVRGGILAAPLCGLTIIAFVV